MCTVVGLAGTFSYHSGNGAIYCTFSQVIKAFTRTEEMQLTRFLLVALTAQLALAGLIIENDDSDLCNQALRDCNSRCAPPQSFLFMCNSGGNFRKPQSDCKCTPAPPAGVVTDGGGFNSFAAIWLLDCNAITLRHRCKGMTHYNLQRNISPGCPML